MKRWFWLGLFILIGVLIVEALLVTQRYTLRGSVIEPARPAPDIMLYDANNQIFHLEQQRGKIILIFFGYTSCPDVCPATLSEMKQLKARLGEMAQKVIFVFVTVDPDRDTQERLKQYLSGFDSTFIGLTGSTRELTKVWQDYGVVREITGDDTAKGYLVSHSSRIYLVDTKGFLRLTYAFGTPFDDMLSDIRYLLNEK